MIRKCEQKNCQKYRQHHEAIKISLGRNKFAIKLKVSFFGNGISWIRNKVFEISYSDHEMRNINQRKL